MLNTISHEGMQIQNIVRYHFTSTEMAKIKRTDNSECWQGWEASNIFHNIAGGNADCYSQLGNWHFLIKLNTHFPHDPRIPHHSISPRGMNTHTHIETFTSLIYRSFIHSIQQLDKKQMSIHEKMDKQIVV